MSPTQSPIATRVCNAMGLNAFADRAGRELPTGATMRGPTVQPEEALTAYELQIAQLAASG
jgi:hypothetical protein